MIEILHDLMYQNSRNYGTTVQYGISIHYLMRLYYSILHCMYSTVVLYCTVLYCTVLYCTVLYCTVLYCTVLYCTVLYCTVLYHTILYYTILYYTILYYTILYYTILYSTILYSTKPCMSQFVPSTVRCNREVASHCSLMGPHVLMITWPCDSWESLHASFGVDPGPAILAVFKGDIDRAPLKGI